MENIYIAVAFVILYLGVLLSIFYFLKWLFKRNWTDRGIWTVSGI